MQYTARDAVRALYRAVLNREGDPSGLANFCDRLDNDPNQLLTVASEFHDSAEHRLLMQQVPALPDHSQHGEFPKILKHLVRTGSRHGLMVDVGARGRDRSNSYDLLTQFGWKAILVEANPSLYEEIRSDFYNTDSILVTCAVGAEEGIQPFYIGANDDVSSLLREAASGWGELRGKVDVHVRRLASILDEYQVPHNFDILSLDIEGVDVAVLNDLIDNSNYRPDLIIIEASYNFETKHMQQVGASNKVQNLYAISDSTASNLFLTLNQLR